MVLLPALFLCALTCSNSLVISPAARLCPKSFGCRPSGESATPIKTEKGWLHIAHGVRNTAAGLRYVIYVFVTALDDPSRVIAEPSGFLIAPRDWERVGDVSNVPAHHRQRDGHHPAGLHLPHPQGTGHHFETQDASLRQLMETSEKKINSDFYLCESTIFIVDDPAAMEQRYGCFRLLDSTDPQEGDRLNIADFAVPLEDTALAGTQSESGADWYVARRLSEGLEENALAQTDALWEKFV